MIGWVYWRPEGVKTDLVAPMLPLNSKSLFNNRKFKKITRCATQRAVDDVWQWLSLSPDSACDDGNSKNIVDKLCCIVKTWRFSSFSSTTFEYPYKFAYFLHCTNGLFPSPFFRLFQWNKSVVKIKTEKAAPGVQHGRGRGPERRACPGGVRRSQARHGRSFVSVRAGQRRRRLAESSRSHGQSQLQRQPRLDCVALGSVPRQTRVCQVAVG